MPTNVPVVSATEQIDEAALDRAIDDLAANDVIVIDTPGHDSALSQLGHARADILVTPINDSLIDFDVLAIVDPEKLNVVRPSHYAERVWKAKQLRAKRDRGVI